MVRGLFGDTGLWALSSALTGVSHRHTALLNNVANVETPGYRRRDVEFRSALQAALQRTHHLQLDRTHERHLNVAGALGAQSARQITGPWAVRADGNGVSLDHEMAALAENALEYQTLARQLAQRFGMLRTVISEGSRS